MPKKIGEVGLKSVRPKSLIFPWVATTDSDHGVTNSQFFALKFVDFFERKETRQLSHTPQGMSKYVDNPE